MLCKNIRPLPAVKEKLEDGKLVRYDEFSDIELRYRKRYLDLLLNPSHRQVFETRSRIVSSTRRFLMNVALPKWKPCAATALRRRHARPFITITTLWMWTSICGSPPSCISTPHRGRV
jgi:lysyl-tRNA synthetase class 2